MEIPVFGESMEEEKIFPWSINRPGIGRAFVILSLSEPRQGGLGQAHSGMPEQHMEEAVFSFAIILESGDVNKERSSTYVWFSGSGHEQ